MLQLLINTVITGAGTVAVFIAQNLWKENRALKNDRREESKKEQGIIKDALCCILRKELIADHDKYVDRGEIPSYAYDNYCLMYDCYHALGGNGMVTGMKEEVDELPIRKRK